MIKDHCFKIIIFCRTYFVKIDACYHEGEEGFVLPP